MGRIPAQLWNTIVNTYFDMLEEFKEECDRLVPIIRDIRVWNGDRMLHSYQIHTVLEWENSACYYLADLGHLIDLQKREKYLQKASLKQPDQLPLCIEEENFTPEMIRSREFSLEFMHFTGWRELYSLECETFTIKRKIEGCREFIKTCRKAGYGI